ncbi:MAG: hypothetical protein INR73_06590 [Williamsia sp.]|nr:hypothetical protein [Williamsia sp.]
MDRQVDNATTKLVLADTVAANEIEFRACRNRLIDMLPLSLGTYPLPDIPVSTPKPVVQYKQEGLVTLSYSQPDVLYNVVFYNTKEQTMEMAAKENKAIQGNGQAISIETSMLTNEDYVFSVVAEKPASRIGTQLLQTVLVKVGIQQDLAVQLVNDPVAYGSKAVVTIKAAQSGTTYQLFGPDNKQLSGETKSGDGGDLNISTTDVLYEDVVISVKSTNDKTGQYGTLTHQPTIRVTPNTMLQPVLETGAADYGGTAYIVLKGTQQSASYQVKFTDIDDDLADKTRLKDLLPGEPVPGGGTIRLPVSQLTEDLTVGILVTKIQTGIQQQLPALVFIPVKPDTSKTLSIAAVNENGATIKVSNTQRGVLYQLKRGADNQDIGKPVYHHKNRGIDGSAGHPERKACIGFDFVVDTFKDDSVYLPTGPLKEPTLFKVLARKITAWPETELVNNGQVKKKTWLEAELLQTIEVTPSA